VKFPDYWNVKGDSLNSNTIKARHGGEWEQSPIKKDSWTIYVYDGEVRTIDIIDTDTGKYGVILNKWESGDAPSPYDWEMLATFKDKDKARKFELNYMKNY